MDDEEAAKKIVDSAKERATTSCPVITTEPRLRPRTCELKEKADAYAK